VVYTRPCRGRHDFERLITPHGTWQCRDCPLIITDLEVAAASPFNSANARLAAIEGAVHRAERDWYIKELES
jgi:hypothetical protein